MLQLDKEFQQKVSLLNDKLELVEQKAYNLSKKENQAALKRLLENQDDIIDYESEIVFDFFIADEHLVSLEEYTKAHFLSDRICQLDDDEDHNVLRSLPKYKVLHNQKHCWLLHQLYDDKCIPWEKIVQIDNVMFDITVVYQYELKI